MTTNFSETLHFCLFDLALMLISLLYWMISNIPDFCGFWDIPTNQNSVPMIWLKISNLGNKISGTCSTGMAPFVHRKIKWMDESKVDIFSNCGKTCYLSMKVTVFG